MRNKIEYMIKYVRLRQKKLLAILLDPDKIVWENLDHLKNQAITSTSLAEAS
jgi:hypothetical protein